MNKSRLKLMKTIDRIKKCGIIKVEKGKTSNGYAIVFVIKKITPTLSRVGVIFLW